MASQSRARAKAEPIQGERATDNNGVTFAGLDPVLGSLGELIGLLKLTDASTKTYTLQNEWFLNPYEKTKAGVTMNPQQFGQLLGQLLGEVGGNALGVPQTDPAILGSWYPIQIKNSQSGAYEPTGLYLVSVPNEDNGEVVSTALGLGVLKKWGLPTDQPLVDVDVWALLPVVAIKADGSFALTFTDPDNVNPISIGVAVEGSKGNSPIINENGISFNGVKFSANLFLSSDPPSFGVTIEVLGLQLADDPKPRNYSLADLEAITPPAILATATQLFVGALSNRFPDFAGSILYFAPLFGLTDNIPESTIKLPPLPWFELFELVSSGGDPSTLFINWFNTLTSQPDQLKGWLTCLSGFLGISGDALKVVGNGSREQPYRATMLSISSVGQLDFTLASVVIDQGHRYLYPGLSFAGTAIAIEQSDAVFAMEADLELAQFLLSTTAPSIALDLNFQTNFALKGKDDTPLLDNVQGITVGSFAGGLALGVTSGKIVPYLELLNVVLPAQTSPGAGPAEDDSPPNEFGVVNLLSPDQLAKVGAVAISGELQQLMGLGDNPSVFLKSLAAIIGLVNPAGAPADWPTPPFSEAGMPDAIQDTIHAWAQYYLNALEAPATGGGPRPFTYLLQSFASLLQVGDAAVTVSGDGTPAQPWKIGISISDEAMPAYLTAFEEEIGENEGLALTFGLEFAPELTLGGVKIVPSLALSALKLAFPTGKSVTANWFQSVAAQLALPEKLATPPLGDTTFSVSSAQLSGSWGQTNGWTWSMLVQQPTLTIGDNPPVVGADLNFSEQSSLQDLVTESAATFGPFFAGALGIALMRTQTRTGILAAGTLGFLTGLSAYPQFQTSGLAWKGFTELPLTSFADPLGMLRAQIASNFSTADKAKSQLGLLAWTLSSADQAPAVPGDGTFDAPYQMPFPAGFMLPVWYDTGTEVIGFGFGRSDQYQYPGTQPVIAVEAVSRLNVLEYDLKTGALPQDGNYPSFTLQTIVSNPQGKLINLPDNLGSLEQVVLGFQIGVANGDLTFAPLITLVQAQLPGQSSASDITLEDFLAASFTEQLKTAFQNLLQAAVQAAIDQVKDKTLFQNAYNVLSLLGLTLTRNPATAAGTDPYGINSAGWTGLLANPLTYIEDQLLQLIATQDNRALLVEVFEALFGFTIPPLPQPAIDLFQGLQILGPADQHYPLYPQAILEIASDPIGSLKDRFTQLFEDDDALKALAQDLTKAIPPMDFGPFVISGTANGVVTLAIPSDKPFTIGETGADGQAEPFLAVSGALALDLVNKRLTVTLDSYVPLLGLTLENAFNITYKNGEVTLTPPTATLIWGTSNKPAAAPLHILPFDSQSFVAEVADLAPAYALNIFVNAIFESQLLTKYPVVQSVFDILGIAKNQDGVWTMPNLLGLLTHPLDWLLSDSVLGVDGKFNIGKLVEKFAAFPQASYQPPGLSTPIAIGPNAAKNGIAITGLPYSFAVEMSGDDDTGEAQFKFSCDQIDIAGDKGSLQDLFFQLSLTKDYQPSFAGGADLATSVGTELFSAFKYDKGFQFSLYQGTPAKPGVGIQFLPFQGWGSLAGQAGAFAAVEVVELVVPKILDYLQPEAPDFVNALNNFGAKVPVDQLLSEITQILSGGGGDPDQLLQELEDKSLAWLKGLFDASGQLSNTIAAVQGIFQVVPQVGAVTVNAEAKGLLQFQPSDKLPLTIYFGLDNDGNLGLWAGLEIPSMQYLNVSVARTGIGVDLDTLSKLAFSFGLQVTIPIDSQNGPGLFLKYDPTTFFNLSIDPLANLKDLGTPSPMAVEIAPVFFAQNGQPPADLGEAVTDWLLQVIKNVLPRYLSILVLNNASVLKWLQFNLFSPVPNVQVQLTPIELLLATTLVLEEKLEDEQVEYVLNSFDAIAEITPLLFLGNLLQKLLENDVTVLTFGEGGSISIGQNPDPEAKGYYGLRLAAPNFKIAALPNIVLQLGAEDTDWIQKSWSKSTAKSIQAGIQFYLPISTDPVSIDFTHFNLILGNVGFDIVGKNGRPIVDLTRFKLGAVEPRVLFDLQFNGADAPSIVFGGNLTLAEMGLSLTPNQLTANGNGETTNSQNPIASNLLGSGSEADQPEKQNPPPNPTFSAQVAYTDQLWVNLVSTTSEGKEIIIPIQRGFGPLFVDSLGVGWDDDKPSNPLLDMLFTGNVTLAGLEVSLIRLSIGIPVETPADFGAYTLDLAGLDVSYKGGSVVINGGLLKQDNPLMYNGAATLKAGRFSIVAMGSYAQVPDPTREGKNVTSLFIFGALDMPLGGPPAFFITGLAAGFGYNRSITIPTVEGIMDFPLVSGVLNGTLTTSNDPAKALQALSTIVAPEVGQYWLAAGLKFKSFELINTAAMLFIQFGKDFEIDILGLSYAALPPELSKDQALAYFELAIKVSIKPTIGIISVEAQLTPNSFVLTKDCKITGGFAFYLWFKDVTQTIDGKQVTIPKGQFVITLGGYHPQFQAPVYYPRVPRLGIQWKMSVPVGSISINGGAYFALCPTAVMAGGYLNVVFVAGPLKAWLGAYANFLIEWKPFYFDVGIGITIGASFGFTVGGVSITISAELGAKLHLQGPPVNGEVEVDWYVISFTIPIGDQQTATKDNLLSSWEAFATNFLPPAQDPVQPDTGFSDHQQKVARLALAAADSTAVQQIVKWNAGNGLQNSNDAQDNAASTQWVVNTMFYSFNVGTAIPTQEITITASSSIASQSAPVGIRPMGYQQSLDAPMTVTVTPNNGDPVDLNSRNITLAPLVDGSPSALWSKSMLNRSQAPNADAMLIPGTLVGMSLTADKYLYLGDIPAFPISNMEYTYGDTRLLPFFLTPKYAPSASLSQDTPFSQIMNSIMSASVIGARNAIYQALAALQPVASSNQSESAGQQLIGKLQASVSIDAPLDPDLSVMASSANLILQVFPVIASIGLYQNNGAITPPSTYVPPKAPPKEQKAYEPRTPQLQGVLRRYQRARGLVAATALPEARRDVHAKWTSYEGFDAAGRPQSLVARASNGSFAKQLQEGGAVVWKVDDQVPHQLAHEGDLSVLVACFDAYQNVLDIRVLRHQDCLTLEKGTAQVLAMAHEPVEHDLVGWQRNTLLTKINPLWAVGDGCLVRVQNAQRLAVNQRRDRTGVVEAESLLARNQVLNARDELMTGWHQTILYTADPYVGVLVEGPVAGLQVSVERNAVPHTLGQTAAVETLAQDGQNLLIYPLYPDKPADASWAGLLVHHEREDSRVLGVYSLAALSKGLKGGRSALKLNYSALDPREQAEKSARLVLTH